MSTPTDTTEPLPRRADRRERLWLAAILLLALAVRVVAAIAWQARVGEGFYFADSEFYWLLARDVAHGRPYGGEGFQVFRTPGYPALLAPLFVLGGDNPPVLWARLEGALLGVATVAGVWWIGRRLFGSRSGLLAAAIAAIYPGAIVSSILVLSETAFMPAMLVCLGLWMVAQQAAGRGRALGFALLTGAAAGGAALVRPSWLLFAPLVACAAVALGPRRSRQALLAGGVLLGLVLAMSPWWIRNWHVTGRFVPTTLQVGASLYDGLSPQATGASDMCFVPAFEEVERLSEEGERRPPTDLREWRIDRRLRQASVEWATSHPLEVVKLAGVKVLRMWNIWPNEASLSAWPVRLVVFFTYVPVLILGIIGAWRTLGRGWAYWFLWLPAVYFTLLHAVFVSSIRYRQPAMLGLIVLAAASVGEMWVKAESRKPKADSRKLIADS